MRLFLGILFLFMATGCAAQEEPDQYIWDFGSAKENAILTHEFIFKNNTSQMLTIQNVSTSCGCTISEVKQKILSPGESTTIEVSFNTKGYRGLVEQYVYVNTDDLDNPVLKYIIKAQVNPQASSKPQ
ncbi:MAG: hypothetical protein A2166_01335 [Omnitrophica WOR_2 bacterium RBG_13_41_10]|nr:MAG: hypothetical protein A2166_01335 [Omnitrophica WOR_2 bacterium RBG_13_41_10]